MAELNFVSAIKCHNCGKECNDKSIAMDGKYFCCNGCKGLCEALTSFGNDNKTTKETRINGKIKSLWNGTQSSSHSTYLPICLLISALYLRSVYEIIEFNNLTYTLIFVIIIFLLMTGDFFKLKILKPVPIEKNIEPHFPAFVTLRSKSGEENIPVSKVIAGDRIIIRNNEIVPVDAILFNGISNVDYSFVSGKTTPEQKGPGEVIYAGGRHAGNAIELEVIRIVSQSYFAKLLNAGSGNKTSGSRDQKFLKFISKCFILLTLCLTFLAAVYWNKEYIELSFIGFVTASIIAWSFTFILDAAPALNSSLKIFRKNRFYLKSLFVIEKLAKIDSIVFDKTGTITSVGDTEIKFVGAELNSDELTLVKSLVRNSCHPISKRIHDYIIQEEYPDVEDFSESINLGISGTMYGDEIKIGSPRFLIKDDYCSSQELYRESVVKSISTNAYVSINNQIKGYYSISNKYRKGLDEVIKDLSKQYSLSVISGDNDCEKNNLKKYFKDDTDLLFNRSHTDKFNYIRMLQYKGKKVLMIGDGLNDASALNQSDVGISVTENSSNLTLSGDGFLEAARFSKLGKLIRFTKSAMKVKQLSILLLLLFIMTGLYVAAIWTLPVYIIWVFVPLLTIAFCFFEMGATKLLAKSRGL